MTSWIKSLASNQTKKQPAKLCISTRHMMKYDDAKAPITQRIPSNKMESETDTVHKLNLQHYPCLSIDNKAKQCRLKYMQTFFVRLLHKRQKTFHFCHFQNSFRLLSNINVHSTQTNKQTNKQHTFP